MMPAAAAGLLKVTLFIRIQPSGVSVPPCIVIPERRGLDTMFTLAGNRSFGVRTFTKDIGF